MKKTFLMILALGVPFALRADLVIPATGTVTEDFQTFAGSGFQSGGGGGTLDSETFNVTGLSDGNIGFSGTDTDGGDHGRGTSAGGVSGGGIYAFDVGGGDIAWGVQPTGADFSPGAFLVRLQNSTANPITSLDVSYGLAVNNNADRGNSFNLGHGATDAGPFTTVNSFTSTELSQGSTLWVLSDESVTISGINIPGFSQYYLAFESNDVTGGGSRDEFGLSYLTVGITAIPEPNSAALIGVGFALLLGIRRLRG